MVDPLASNPVTYRTHRVSRDLQIWFVEGRDYRDPLDMPDSPDKTIWGAEQKAWLKQTLIDSDATFKLLISPTPMVGPDDASKRDNHTDINGYRYEGDAFFEWLVDRGFSPNEFFIACGDRHWQYHAVPSVGIRGVLLRRVGGRELAARRASRRPGVPPTRKARSAMSISTTSRRAVFSP